MAKNDTYEVGMYRKNGIKRFILVGISLILELTFIVVTVNNFSNSFAWVDSLIRFAAFIFAIYIYSLPKTSAIKTPWVILMLLLPVFGVVLYLLVGLSGSTRNKRDRFAFLEQEIMPHLNSNEEVINNIDDKDVSNISKYLLNYSGYPIYNNSDVTYYADTNKALDSQLKEMKKAKKFIFLEYHAIEAKIAWQKIQDVLSEKVKEGVEVRIFYDDVGSIFFINYDFVSEMEKLGIKCKAFNIFKTGLRFFLNNRDHRKMTIIDGKVGFVGGYNLADEYFNITHPYGVWKDAGIKISGEAVKNLTAAYLQMWNGETKKKDSLEDFSIYFPEVKKKAKEEIYIQPYADSPMDNETVGENVYINIINSAKDYVWFMTPYLIITDEMIKAMTLAAKKGVDVRIVTPGIPDKKMTYNLTRSYYHSLVIAGVKIYEWTPGFCHAKLCLADDVLGTVGTINLDYRSLYHHFENGCLIYKGKALKDLKKDFEKSFAEAKDVSKDYRTGRSAVLRMSQLLLRTIAELI